MPNFMVTQVNENIVPRMPNYVDASGAPSRVYDCQGYTSQGVRVMLRGRPVNTERGILFEPETLEVLRAQQIPADTWYGVTQWINPDDISASVYPGTTSSVYGYVFNKYVLPLETMHLRCANCKLAIMAHQGMKCLYGPDNLDVLSHPGTWAFLDTASAQLLYTGIMVPLKEFYSYYENRAR